MDVYFCGVRGSVAAPGADFVRYGGNTSCVAVAHDGQAPTLVIDAGTGIRNVSSLLDEQPFRGTIVISHLHWDHVQGLPFFSAADRSGARVQTLVPDRGRPGLEELSGLMVDPYFPIGPQDLRGSWRHGTLEEGRHRTEGFDLLARAVPHKGGRTFGYRVDDGRSALAYVSDHEPTVLGPGPKGLGAYHEAVLALARDADVLIHDAQYQASELPAMAGFGHATVDYAVGLAEHAQVRHLVLFHHAPSRTDDELDEILAAVPPTGGLQVSVATEGSVLCLGRGHR